MSTRHLVFFLCKNCGALCILPLKSAKTYQNRAKNSQITRRSPVFEVLRRNFFASKWGNCSVDIILFLIRDFIRNSFRNVQKFSDLQFLSPMTFYEGVYRGNKKCRANALPGTMVRLDHPDRNDIIFRIDGRQFGAHAENGAAAARNGSFIQVIECADPFVAGIDGAHNF